MAAQQLTIPRYSTVFFQEDGLEIEVPVGGAPRARKAVYDADHLKIYNRNLGFLADSRFKRAYARGMQSGHQIGGTPGADLQIEFRVYISTWAASVGIKLEGDFVECGVNTGIHALAICDYVDFARLPKRFFLFDTFSGGPEEQVQPHERPLAEARASYYPDCFARAQANFASYPNVRLVRGRVPDTLPSAGIERVAFLSIDMEFAAPERAAIEFFWDKLSPGGPVLLAGYGWMGYEAGKASMDEFAKEQGVEILTLPTGQGLMLKPR